MKKSTSNTRGPAKKATADPKAVDAYLAALSEPARSTLKKMRAAILSVVPKEATEAISYGMPGFKYNGSQVWYAAFANHCSFFPGSLAVMKALENDLKNFETSKGTIRFPPDKPLPAALVKKIVKARLAEKNRKKPR